MKKLKKVFAVLLTLAMVLGMSMTTFAASVAANGGINVSGLKAEATDVTIYNVVKPDENGNAWKIADWAKDITGAVDAKTNPYTIDVSKLAEAVDSATVAATKSTSTGTVSFDNLEAGVYLVIAKTTVKDSTTTYNPMLAVTYNKDSFGTTENYLRAVTANVVAKSANIQVGKEAAEGDKYVAVGTDASFTITTTFPSFHDENGANTDGTYKIVDTPTNLSIKANTVVVKVGDDTLDATSGSYTVSVAESGVMTIEFAKTYIGKQNAHAGATVVVTYDATVTALQGGISNTANAVVDENEVGTDIETVYPGSIEMTKYAEDGSTALAGAEFIVYTTRDGETVYAITNTANEVTGWGTEEEAKAHTLTTGTDGKVTINGLDADESYSFKEVVAPAGYTLNTIDSSATWTPAGANAGVRTGTATMNDTRLSSLPSTGGIGTTIFTIGGCAIMVIAAALFFASRRKSAK